MLLPALAKRVLREHNEKLDPEGSERLPESLEEAGVSVINMNGIYFRHFMQLFCDVDGTDHDGRVPIRCAGLTDKDPGKSADAYLANAEGKNPALKLIPTVNQSKWSRIYSGRFQTLEYDLAVEAANMSIMYQVAESLRETVGSVKKQMHAYSICVWPKEIDKKKDRAASFLLKHIEKGRFAQALANHLAEKKDLIFTVPQYIHSAVFWACGGNPDER